jgi:hypothetical protein
MPAFTLPVGQTDKEIILAHLRGSLPRSFFSRARAQEVLHAIADVYATVMAQGLDWVRMTYIQHADGAWLRQHGRDRGIYQQSGEAESEFRDRIRSPEDLITPVAILAIADRLLTSAGVAGSARLVELPRDAYFDPEPTATIAEAEGYGFDHGNPEDYGYLSPAVSSAFIVILSAGASSATVSAISDAVRVAKAGGIIHSVEVVS